MDEIMNVLTRGVSDVLPNKEGLARLMSDKKIRLYQGFDPSMPSLHLGNFVGLMKLRQFQKLGHEVIFLVGDFTGMIGDPTDKLSSRKKLTREEVLANAKLWKEQASRLLDFEGSNAAKFMFNSEWSDKLTFKELIEVTSKFTVQQMIERDMFQKRLKENKPIYLHEFLYPVAQAIDCVEMEVDLEIGGSDQVFNMLAGRTLMKAVKNREKYVLATKLLVDKEGNKVGKTTGNALFLDSTPSNFYAGIMSFPDEVLSLSYELLTELPLEGIEEKVKKDPMGEKKRLAYEVVKLLWGDKDATNAESDFKQTFQEKKPEFDLKIKISDNLVNSLIPYLPNPTASEAKRFLVAGSVEVNGETIKDRNFQLAEGDKVQIGKLIFGTATK